MFNFSLTILYFWPSWLRQACQNSKSWHHDSPERTLCPTSASDPATFHSSPCLSNKPQLTCLQSCSWPLFLCSNPRNQNWCPPFAPVSDSNMTLPADPWPPPKPWSRTSSLSACLTPWQQLGECVGRRKRQLFASLCHTYWSVRPFFWQPDRNCTWQRSQALSYRCWGADWDWFCKDRALARGWGSSHPTPSWSEPVIRESSIRICNGWEDRSRSIGHFYLHGAPLARCLCSATPKREENINQLTGKLLTSNSIPSTPFLIAPSKLISEFSGPKPPPLCPMTIVRLPFSVNL